MFNSIPSIFRLTLAVMLGIVISSMTVLLSDTMNAKLFPSGILSPTIEQQAELIAKAPLEEYLFVLGGFIIAAFLGGYTAGRIAPSDKKIISALTVGFFMVLSGIIYFITYTQPVWLMVASGISYMLFSYLGGRVANYFHKSRLAA